MPAADCDVYLLAAVACDMYLFASLPFKRFQRYCSYRHTCVFSRVLSGSVGMLYCCSLELFVAPLLRLCVVRQPGTDIFLYASVQNTWLSYSTWTLGQKARKMFADMINSIGAFVGRAMDRSLVGSHRKLLDQVNWVKFCWQCQRKGVQNETYK